MTTPSNPSPTVSPTGLPVRKTAPQRSGILPVLRRSFCSSSGLNKRGLSFVALLLVVFLTGQSVGQLQAANPTNYFWDADADGSALTGGTGNWDVTTALWRAGSSTGGLGLWSNTGLNNDATLGDAFGTLTLTTGISVNDITVNPSPSGAYIINGAQTLTLNGAAQSVIDVASGSTFTISSVLAGANGFTKSNAGTLILDTVQGTGGVFGGLTISGGTLQVGTTNAIPGYNTASQALRSNAVNIAGGASLTSGAATGLVPSATSDLRVGSLSGSGSIAPGNNGAVQELALSDSTFSGTITTTGGLNLRGGNGTTQTFDGNLTALTGTVAVNSGATLKLSGTGDSTSGVIGGTTIALRGGTFLLDNSGGNTSAGTERVSNTAAVTLMGGTLSLIGNSAGTTETVGTFAMNASSSTVSVTNNGGTGAQLTFTDGGNLRDSTAGTVNFVGLGTGTLGSAGNASRITFTSAVNANTVNGALTSTASGATSVTYGWARVNDTSWAGNGANGIVALAETARDSSTLGSAAANEITTFTPSTTTTTLTANLGAAATSLLLKITPSGAGQSLDSGGFNINASAVMLAGNTDFAITGTGSMFGTVASTRYIYTTDANTVFSVSQSFAGANQPFIKSGAGTVFLNGASNQLGFTTVQNVNIVEGTLRGTLTSLGGGASTGGAFTTTNLYGGVLEISGGGTYSRALNGTGAAGGGGLKWDASGTARGDGGFSAIGGDATVTLVTAIGGSTAATPVWNAGGFVSNGYALTMGSTKADSRIDFTNNIGLDDTSIAGGAANSYFAREVRVADNTGSTTDTARLSGVISGSANADLLKTGAGVLELTNTNTYSGNTLIQQGKLVLINGAAIGDTSAVILSNIAGAALQLNNSETIGALSGGGATGGNVDLQANTLTVGDTRDSAYAGSISGTGGSLVKQGSGRLTLDGVNTYTGATFIRNGGTLLANVAGALPTATRSAVTLDDSGTGSSTLALGANQVAASIAGAASSKIVLNGNNLLVGITTGSSTFNGVISDNLTPGLTPGGSLTKDGGSELILTGSNTYTGDTNVDSGKLTLASPGMITSNVIVKSGATFASSGTISGHSLTVQSGGSFYPGDVGAAGASTISGALVLSTGSNSYFDIGGTSNSQFDRLLGLTSLDLHGTLNFGYINGFTASNGQSFNIIDWGTTPTVVSSTGLVLNFAGAGGDSNWNTSNFLTNGTISYIGTPAVPEPSRALLLLLGMLCMVMRRRRRL